MAYISDLGIYVALNNYIVQVTDTMWRKVNFHSRRSNLIFLETLISMCCKRDSALSRQTNTPLNLRELAQPSLSPSSLSQFDPAGLYR